MSSPDATAAKPGESPEEIPLKRVIGQRVLLIFIVGDILGAGIYALVGEVGAEVGGAIWASFTAALVLAVLTAFAYAELVTKYPQAAGTALYVDRAFGIPFLTFMVAFAVMASGITSASTLSRAFAGDYFSQFLDLPLLLVALLFIAVVAAINLRGISESVRVNVVLTIVEVAGLALIVLIGAVALGQGDADFGRNFEFREGESVVFAIAGGAALAFYALIGFEDAVNVAEETRDPSRVFPRALFGGLAIAGVIYLLVTLTASMVVPTGTLADSDGPLLEVVRLGPLDIPEKLFAFIALLAVANGALINMIMASRLVYGMARRAGAAAGLRPRAGGAAHAARGDRRDHPAGRHPHLDGGPEHAGRHHRAPAPARVRDRERERAGAQARRGATRPLQGTGGATRARGRRVGGPDRGHAARRPRGGAARGPAAAARRGALRGEPGGHEGDGVVNRIVLACVAGQDQPWLAEAAAELARELEATVSVVAVDDAESQRFEARPRDELIEAARDTAGRLAGLLAERGVGADTHVRAGRGAGPVIAFADEVEADLIVVGAAGRDTGVVGRLLGSLPIELVKEAGRQVLVVTDPGGRS